MTRDESTEYRAGNYYINVILPSKGMAARNRYHLHTFTVNIYRGNARELIRVLDLAENPRFVRDLRNYITHRALPDSRLEIRATPIGEAMEGQSGIPVSLQAGVKYGRDRFLEWDRWSSPARRYLEKQEAYIRLGDIFEPHGQVVESYFRWFEREFNSHHKSDFQELQEMFKVHAGLEEEEKSAHQSDRDKPR